MPNSAAISKRGPTPAPVGEPPLLDVRDLRVHFPFARGPLWRRVRGAVRAVDGVSFQLRAGETLGLVGESGCGKSTTARAIVGLVQPTEGEVWLAGRRIDGLSAAEMRPERCIVQMVFQDPLASLNPRWTAAEIIREPLALFGLLPRREQLAEVVRLMDLVGLNPRHLYRYPHEFSGGQRQRIGIARALAVRPKLLVCDEPVSALDVSVQAQVINLLQDLQRDLGLSYLFIAHDLSVVRHLSHRIGVMYLGRLVELGPAEQVCAAPRHPYTQALLSAAPVADPVVERARQRIVLQGEIPSPDRVYAGCPFADRCPIAETACRSTPQQLTGEEHAVACMKA